MKIAIFDAKEYDKTFFDRENKGRHEISYFKENLSMSNIEMVKGFDAVCGFVNTEVNAEALKNLMNWEYQLDYKDQWDTIELI